MTKQKEKVKESREDRLKRIRKETEDAIREAPVRDPEKFDASKVQEALDALAKVSDDNLDAYLIMGKPLSILLKQIEFSAEEIKKFKSFFEKYGINSDTHSEQDDRSRDDWMFNINAPKTTTKLGVWINKSEPMFGNKGYYNILWFGSGLSPYMRNFASLDEMLNHLKPKIEEYDK